MNHLEILKLELKSAKTELKTKQATLKQYKSLTVTRHTKINDKAKRSLIFDYEVKFIPRLEKMIAALEFAIPLVEARY